MREQKNIVCNIDDGFVKHCVVMLTSLFVNNKDSAIHIHIVADALSEDSKKVLLDVVEKRFGQRLSFYMVDKNILSKCPIDPNSHISISTYYRCFLTTILPSEISKVLYLDCDLIVDGDITDLWNINIDDYAIGAVEDMWSGKNDNYSRLQYSESYSYFNGGVLLINLDYWRNNNIESKITDYISKYPERLLYNDQCVLNAVLHSCKLLIPFRWNIQDGLLRRKKKIRKSSLAELNEEMSHPVIIHYTGGKKPWQYKSQNPYKMLYYNYLDMTQWKGERPKVPILYKMKLLVDKVLCSIGVFKPKYGNVKYHGKRFSFNSYGML